MLRLRATELELIDGEAYYGGGLLTHPWRRSVEQGGQSAPSDSRSIISCATLRTGTFGGTNSRKPPSLLRMKPWKGTIP